MQAEGRFLIGTSQQVGLLPVEPQMVNKAKMNNMRNPGTEEAKMAFETSLIINLPIELAS